MRITTDIVERETGVSLTDLEIQAIERGLYFDRLKGDGEPDLADCREALYAKWVELRNALGLKVRR